MEPVSNPSIDDNVSVVSSFLGTDVTEYVTTDRYGFTGGNQFTEAEKAVSVKKIRQRETKWRDMTDNWDKWISSRFLYIKKRCRKGIPSSFRGKAWQYLCGSKFVLEQRRGEFEELLTKPLPANVTEDINKDLHRQFPFHEMFQQQGGTGQQDLHNVLYAYAAYNPIDGYCQAQAPVAAVILMHMPAEEAFWCFVAVLERYIPGYYSPGLEAVQIDGHVLQGLFRKVSAVGYKHLQKSNIEPLLYCQEWLMCLFARTLPWPSVLRLWDIFFCEGIKVVFRCSLVLLKQTIGSAALCRHYTDLYDTLEALRKMDTSIMQPEKIIVEVINLKVSEGDLEKEFKNQLKIQQKHHPKNGKAKRNYRFKPSVSAVFKRNSTSSSSSKQKPSANQNQNAMTSTIGSVSSSSSSGRSTVKLKSYTPHPEAAMFKGLQDHPPPPAGID